MQERGHKKERLGIVVRNKMDKTITVAIERRVPHPLYKKALRRTRRYHAHDKNNECNVGDLVRIRETRRMSKTKRWRMVEIVKRAD